MPSPPKPIPISEASPQDPDPTGRPGARPGARLLVGSLVEGGLVLLAAVLAYVFAVPLWDLMWPAERLPIALTWGLAATLPMVAFFVLMLTTSWRPLANLRDQAQQLVGGLVKGAGWLPVVLLAVMAGIGEEALFRGVLQPLAIRWLTPLGPEVAPWIGMVAVSLLFGLAHPMSTAYIVVATLAGLFLGTLALLTGEVLSATIAHALYDVVALGWMKLTLDRQPIPPNVQNEPN